MSTNRPAHRIYDIATNWWTSTTVKCIKRVTWIDKSMSGAHSMLPCIKASPLVGPDYPHEAMENPITLTIWWATWKSIPPRWIDKQSFHKVFPLSWLCCQACPEKKAAAYTQQVLALCSEQGKAPLGINKDLWIVANAVRELCYADEGVVRGWCR